MGLQPVSNQRDIPGADRPPLNDPWSVHGPRNTQKQKLSPEKKKNIFWVIRCRRPTSAPNPPDATGLAQNENCWAVGSLVRGGRDKSGGYEVREAQKSSNRPE